MCQLLKDEVGNNIPIGISVITNEGDFLSLDSILISMVGFEPNNINEHEYLHSLFLSERKEDIHIKNSEDDSPKAYKIKFVRIGDVYHLVVMDISLFIDKHHILNLSIYSVDNNQMPILWMKEDGSIIYSNNAADKLSDDSPNVGKYIYRMASDIQKDEWDILWDKLKHTDDVSFVHNYYSKKLDRLFTLNIMCNRVKYYDWEYCQMVLTDITELMEMNLVLSKEKKKAEESEKLKSMFLSNMSHEIRTPMNAIIGFSEILNERVQDNLTEYTNIVIQNGDYLLSLIDNIIDISRVDSEEIKLNIRRFDVMNILDNLYFKYSNILAKQDKDIELILDIEDPLYIESDSYIIEQCLERLIDNSIKFTKEGIIFLGYKKNKNQVTFYVKDTGIGIDKKYHEIIFDRFRQIHKQSMGSGLGLAVFKSYVEVLNGSYNINASEENGTELSFTLNRGIIGKNTELDFNHLYGKKIMVCDDLEINQMLINDILTPYGVEVIKCSDGKECVDKFIEMNDIDLILMDLNMPVMNGYEATLIIRERNKDIPIIAQTAYSHKENRERTKRIGFNDFIPKPIKKEELLKKVTEYLHRPKF